MCTVTFIPNQVDEFVLTSNRDEAPGRETIAPQLYLVDGVDLLFPKDKKAGGTWIGLSEKKRLICLLNGGFVAHDRASSYTMSRGVVVTQLLTTANVLKTINSFNFEGIEPFTIVMVTWEDTPVLEELVWDGAHIHLRKKTWTPHIWSSSLLYTSAVKIEREAWFSSFLLEKEPPNTAEILKFHTTAGAGNPTKGLIMDRGFVKTKSITQVCLKEASVQMCYHDLEKENNTTILF
jgi:hypothetical protein